LDGDTLDLDFVYYETGNIEDTILLKLQSHRIPDQQDELLDGYRTCAICRTTLCVEAFVVSVMAAA